MYLDSEQKIVAGTDKGKSHPLASTTPFCSTQWLYKHRIMTGVISFPKLQPQDQGNQEKRNYPQKINNTEIIQIDQNLKNYVSTRKYTTVAIQ